VVGARRSREGRDRRFRAATISIRFTTLGPFPVDGFEHDDVLAWFLWEPLDPLELTEPRPKTGLTDHDGRVFAVEVTSTSYPAVGPGAKDSS
jgi:hypothetical protein